MPLASPLAFQTMAQARAAYADMGLDKVVLLDLGREVQLMTWLGDSANEAIACLLMRRGFTAVPSGPGVEVYKGSKTSEDILDALIEAGIDEAPALDILLADVQNLQREKWDWALPTGLLRRAYASLYLDLGEATRWTRRIS